MSYRAWAVQSIKYNYKALKTLKTASKWTMNQLLTKPGGFHKDSMDWKKVLMCSWTPDQSISKVQHSEELWWWFTQVLVFRNSSET